MITQNLPAANRTVAGVDLLIGDGGREAAGHYPENVEDCVARSLAFALNDGADDGGLLYSVAWQLVTRCNSAGETADRRQPMRDYRRAYRGCGFRYRKWYTTGMDFNEILGWLKRRTRGNVVVVVGDREYGRSHCYAVRRDDVVLDSWNATFDARNGRLARHKVYGIWVEMPRTEKLRELLADLDGGTLHRSELVRRVLSQVVLPRKDCPCAVCRDCPEEVEEWSVVCWKCRMKGMFGIRGHGQLRKQS